MVLPPDLPWKEKGLTGTPVGVEGVQQPLPLAKALELFLLPLWIMAMTAMRTSLTRQVGPRVTVLCLVTSCDSAFFLSSPQPLLKVSQLFVLPL